jgi:hypothetical protein
MTQNRKVNPMFVFWARHSNDIDHMAPIIYGFLKNGIPASQIRYIAIIPKKYIMPEEDKRLIFLKSRGVDFEMPHRMKGYMDVAYRLSKKPPRHLIGRFIQKVVRFVYYRYLIGKDQFNWPNWHYALKVIDETPKGSVFVFDHKHNVLYRKLVNEARKKGIVCVAAPHGLKVFYEMPGGVDYSEVRKLFDENGLMGFYDRVLMPNPLYEDHAFKLGLSKEKMAILGSARFCREWMEIIEELYPRPPALPKNKDHLNILFLLEKGATRRGMVSFVDRQMVTLDYLMAEPNIHVAVKLNPRSISKEQVEKLKKVKCLQFDNEYTTAELVAWADVVVAGATSTTFDPLSRGKTVIIMDYVQPVTMVYHEYQSPIIAGSLDEFREWITKIKNAPHSRYYREQDTQRLLDDFVYANNKEKNVLKAYYRFITGLQNDDREPTDQNDSP